MTSTSAARLAERTRLMNDIREDLAGTGYSVSGVGPGGVMYHAGIRLSVKVSVVYSRRFYRAQFRTADDAALILSTVPADPDAARVFLRHYLYAKV